MTVLLFPYEENTSINGLRTGALGNAVPSLQPMLSGQTTTSIIGNRTGAFQAATKEVFNKARLH